MITRPRDLYLQQRASQPMLRSVTLEADENQKYNQKLAER
jgi:hypothetical protein